MWLVKDYNLARVICPDLLIFVPYHMVADVSLNQRSIGFSFWGEQKFKKGNEETFLQISALRKL